MDGFFIECGFTSERVCVQCSSVQITSKDKEALPLVLKDTRSCFSQGEGSLYSRLLITRFPSKSRILD